jgi:divalent metal cation (Fe/Co/Zn/Cd) transporter
MSSTPDALESRIMLLRRASIGGIALIAVAELATGISARSIALVSIGFYSMIGVVELGSGAAARWRFETDLPEIWPQAVKLMTEILVGFWSLVLAVSVAFEGVRSLRLHQRPSPSFAGAIILALVLIMRPLIVRAKRGADTALGDSMHDAAQDHVSFAAYLPGLALVGVVLNIAFRWWWADPIAALAMVPLIAEQGAVGLRRAFRGSKRA